MDKLKLTHETFSRVLKTLKEIVTEDYSVIVRDATIQRFEYTFEAFWKLIKAYLKETEGISCNSPKSCFRELFSINIIDRETTEKLLEMTDMRNLTSHAYIEKVADDIYKKIISTYHELLEAINNTISTRNF